MIAEDDSTVCFLSLIYQSIIYNITRCKIRYINKLDFTEKIGGRK